ncbi:SMI1/KNR4 family protein [Flagellimonas sp. 2504JD4-2]
MKPLDQLKSILGNQYESEDGDLYEIELLDGMSESEISAYQKSFPNQQLPEEIKELLGFARGFEFLPLEEIHFDSYGQFGFEEMFLHSIPLAGDGFGNFWILDIDSKGGWNNVYYVCHDPPVMVKHSEGLADFIEHINEYGQKVEDSHLEKIHEKTIMDVWQEKHSIMEQNELDYDFPAHINEQLPKMFMVADLSDKPVITGFAWGKFGASSKIIRVDDKPIWIIEKRVKQGFLARLLGKS